LLLMLTTEPNLDLRDTRFMWLRSRGQIYLEEKSGSGAIFRIGAEYPPDLARMAFEDVRSEDEIKTTKDFTSKEEN
ncbi:MAG: hypothetical protein ABIP88_03750, partial [Candidatus Binatia bacterium]